LFILRLLAPLLLAVLAYWALVRLQRRYSLSRQQFYGLLAGTAILLVVLIMIVLGRLPLQALLAPFLFMLTFGLRNAHWLMRLLTMMRQRSRAAGAAGRRSGSSKVSTDWLSMELAHSTGTMDGLVRKGSFQGQRLSAMDLRTLLALAQECQADTDSLQLLEAYLDRMHADWRKSFDDADSDASAQGSQHSGAEMTGALALEILGLHQGASREEVIAAHRRLMQKLHPDRGGSDYLAQRINAARDCLLDEHGRPG
jgi:hypothetical protein